MNVFHWLDSMSVGLVEFDSDHRRVVTLLGEIAAAAESGDHGAAVVLAETLVKVAEDHIRREDAFLHKIEFPGADEVVGAQSRNLDNLRLLAHRLRDQPDGAGDIAADMAREFVVYLLRADVNYKSYVEHMGLADC